MYDIVTYLLVEIRTNDSVWLYYYKAIRNQNYFYMNLTFIFLINLIFSLSLSVSLFYALYYYVSKCFYFQKEYCVTFICQQSVELISICIRRLECLLSINVQEFQINIWHLTELIWQTVVKFIAVEDIFYNHIRYNFKTFLLGIL